MIDKLDIIMLMFASVIVVIVSLIILFKNKLVDWDKELSNNLKKMLKQNNTVLTDEKDISFLPTVHYEVSDLSPSGIAITYHKFSASGKELEDCIETIARLRMLAMGKFDVEEEKQDKGGRHYVGIG